MGFTKALFYPTIDIKNENWLKSAVLFWDKIYTIVPSSIDYPYKKNTTQYLAGEGIIEPMRVNPSDDLIEELTIDVQNYLNTNEGLLLLTQRRGRNSLIHRDKLPRDVSNLFEIHPDKLPYEIQHQLRMMTTEEGWFRVDSTFAVFYMTLLANKICEQNHVALLTDNSLTSNFSDLVRLDSQNRIKRREHWYHCLMNNEKHIHLAQGILTNLIIQGVNVTEDSSLKDIINFKNRHRDELGNFRNNISRLTKDIKKGKSFEAIKQEIEDIYKDEFLPAFNDLKKSLNSAGIKWTADNLMKVSFFSTSATAIPMVLLGLSLPQALLAGAGVSIISSLVSYNVDKKDILRKNPYSYLLSIDQGKI